MYEHKSNRSLIIFSFTQGLIGISNIIQCVCFGILKVNTVCSWLQLDEWVAQLWLMTTSLVPTYTGHTDNHSTLSEQAHTHIHLPHIHQTEGNSWVFFEYSEMNVWGSVVHVSTAPWYVISVPLQMLWKPTPCLNAFPLMHYILKVSLPLD